MNTESPRRRRFPLAKSAAFTAVLVIAAYLLTRHGDHNWQLLPYGLLLACPLMHILHHGRHRNRH